MKAKKSKWIGVLIVVAMLVTMLSSVVGATSVTPEPKPNWQSGDAYFERDQIGCKALYAFKIDDWDKVDPFREHNTVEGNTITITEKMGGISFDWESEFPVCAVIVKGGTSANVYKYEPGAYEGTNLFAPTNPKNGKPYAISHVTFCFNPPAECYWKGETAWSDGVRYNEEQGNWATYTEYGGVAKTVKLYAGQTKDAGTVIFSAVDENDNITITITLNNRWRFNDVENNVKIQGYASAPSGNPAPGGFATKEYADPDNDSFTITVDANNFYGVHVDVERCIAIK